jgi:hypothetical protein
MEGEDRQVWGQNEWWKTGETGELTEEKNKESNKQQLK